MNALETTIEFNGLILKITKSKKVFVQLFGTTPFSKGIPHYSWNEITEKLTPDIKTHLQENNLI